MRMSFSINLEADDSTHSEHLPSPSSDRKRHGSDMITPSRNASLSPELSFQTWPGDLQFLSYLVTKYTQLKMIIEARKASIDELKARHSRLEIWDDRTTDEEWARKKEERTDLRSQIRRLDDRRGDEDFRLRILRDDIHRVGSAASYRTAMEKNLCNHILRQMPNNQAMLFGSPSDT